MSLVYADTEPMDTPIYRTVRRTPFERLFSLPWRPWVATKEERDYQAEAAARIEELHQRLRDWRATRPIASRSLPARVSAIHISPTTTAGTATGFGYPPSVTAFTIAPASFAPPPAIAFPLPDVTERGNSAFQSLGGGDFGGAGATSSWEPPAPAPAPATDTYQASSSYSDSSSSCSSDSSSSSSDSSSSCSSAGASE